MNRTSRTAVCKKIRPHSFVFSTFSVPIVRIADHTHTNGFLGLKLNEEAMHKIQRRCTTPAALLDPSCVEMKDGIAIRSNSMMYLNAL